MKTCKKILAGVLVLAMMMSMCAFVSADDTTETETTVTDKLLVTHNFDGLAGGTVLNSGKTFSCDGGASDKVLYAKGGSPSNKLNTTTVVEEGTNKYITTTHNRLGYNPYWTDSDFKKLGFGDELSVFSTSYDIMIPANDTYKENRRYATVNAGAYVADDYTKFICTPAASIYSGKIVGSASDSQALYSKTIDYTYGDWVTIRIDAWINADNGISSAVYADGELIYAGKYTGSNTAVGMACRFIEFMYSNVSSGTTVTSTAATSGIESVTCYDNIEISLLTADNEVTAEEIAAKIAADEAEAAAKKAATPYIRLIEYTGDKLNATYVKDGVGTSGKSVFDSTGSMNYSMVQAGATDDHNAAAYTVVEETDRTYTNVTTSSYRYLLTNVRGSFNDYVQKDSNIVNTFVYSNDLNLKDFNAALEGSFAFGLDLSSVDTVDPTNPTGDKITARKTNDVAVGFNIGTDGNIAFSGSTVGYGSVVPNKVRSEERAVTVGEWINVKMIFEVIHGETAYTIKAYGVYEDDVIYENEFALTYIDYDKDGVADDIHVGMFHLKIGTDGKPHTETVTGVDNIYFDKNNNFDWTAINTDAWLERIVELNPDESGNVDVVANKGGDGFASGVLVVALYDANGKLVEIIKSTDITDGKFVLEVPAAKVATAKTIKGFVFDGITTAVPQMKHGALVIE